MRETSVPGRHSSTSWVRSGSAMFFLQAEAGIRSLTVTGVQACALPIFVLLGPPAGGERRGLLLKAGELLFEPRQAILGGGVRFLAERLLLDLEPDDFAVERIEFLRDRKSVV